MKCTNSIILLSVLSLIIFAGCSYPAEPLTIVIQPNAIQLIYEQPQTTATPSPTVIVEPSPTQEIATWTPQPFPTEITIYEVTNTSNSAFRVRDAPITGNFVMWLMPGAMLEYTVLTLESDGYYWINVILPNGSTGFIRSDCCNLTG